MARKPTQPKWRKQLRELAALDKVTQQTMADYLEVSKATVWRLLHYEDQPIKHRVVEAIEKMHVEAFGE